MTRTISPCAPSRCARISVSRILSQWQREGLLEKDRRTIAVRQALFEDLNDWIDGTGDSRHTCLEAYRRPVLP